MPSRRTLLAASLLLAIASAEAAPPQTKAIPDHMQAITIDGYGGVEVMNERTVPVPVLAPDEVLIAVHTAGVGPWDAEVRAGDIAEKTAHFPLILGTDGSGTIAAIGSAVRTLHVGQAVYSYSWANPKGGFYAQYAAVAARRVAPIPSNVGMKQAGALATTGLTAVQGIDDALHIHKGQLLIIHGAQGGVGTIALQLAKLRGARVFATASGADGLALVRRLGADVAVDGHSDDVAAAVKRFAPKGADALLALAAGPALDQLKANLRDGAPLAYPSGVTPEPKADGRIKLLRYDAIPGVAEFARLNQALESIKAEVPIAAEYPMADVRQAHQRVAAGHLLGKVILRIQ
jgi:NADPH:quinone reductase-like Zn-dependent oxidoreductase